MFLPLFRLYLDQTLNAPNMAGRYSTHAHKACTAVDDSDIMRALHVPYRAPKSYSSAGKSKIEPNESPTHIETSQPSNTDAWSPKSRSNNLPENSITTRMPSPSRGSRKVRKAFKAMCRMLSPNRATQGCPCSTDSGHGHTVTPAYVGQPNQDQARYPGEQGNNLPKSPRTYPVRSAMRGARPKKAADSSRRVQFAEEARQPSQQKHEIPTDPRTFPLRSAIRGSRPKQATDSSRHVHFAGGAPGWLRRDADA